MCSVIKGLIFDISCSKMFEKYWKEMNTLARLMTHLIASLSKESIHSLDKTDYKAKVLFKILLTKLVSEQNLKSECTYELCATYQRFFEILGWNI